MKPSRSRGDRGSALIEVTWLGLLLLLPLVYLLVSVFDVQRASFGVSGAARAAARAVALAPDEQSALERAHAVAAVALRDQRIDPAEVDLEVHCRPRPDDCLSPGSLIRVDLRHQVRLPLAPAALGGSAPSFRVSASHTVVYGQYREGR